MLNGEGVSLSVVNHPHGTLAFMTARTIAPLAALTVERRKAALAHHLAGKGFSLTRIAVVLGVSRAYVRRLLAM
ncbi:MAG: hypothetical protein BroJett003_01670 [Planctomycetota bacterium]|nr:MAG: hypothetical protein BroJett003_01670 [Planctomycetota bacterium]